MTEKQQELEAVISHLTTLNSLEKLKRSVEDAKAAIKRWGTAQNGLEIDAKLKQARATRDAAIASNERKLSDLNRFQIPKAVEAGDARELAVLREQKIFAEIKMIEANQQYEQACIQLFELEYEAMCETFSLYKRVYTPVDILNWEASATQAAARLKEESANEYNYIRCLYTGPEEKLKQAHAHLEVLGRERNQKQQEIPR